MGGTRWVCSNWNFCTIASSRSQYSLSPPSSSSELQTGIGMGGFEGDGKDLGGGGASFTGERLGSWCFDKGGTDGGKEVGDGRRGRGGGETSETLEVSS